MSFDEKQVDLDRQRTVLKKLMPEYVSVYHIELNSGRYEILRLSKTTNARQLIGDEMHMYANFDEYTDHYAAAFILNEDKKEFLEWHLCKNLKKQLLREDKATYHYRSVSKDGQYTYYEAYAVKEKVDENAFWIFLGYRNVNNILYKEKAIQDQLKRALDEARLGNEIISAIAKTYQYISRIDIEADWFEEISNRNKENLDFVSSGTMSVNNKKVCEDKVAEEYQEAFAKFTDLKTLPERMKDEETIVLEYRMKDGSWHKLRFIEKKRDETGKLTHVLCAIRSISAAKKKEQELIYAAAKAKEEAALKTKFLSNMSHDIRTPMNGIIGMVDLANRHPDDPDIQQKCRDKILESSKYLVSLVNDILDMNKLESGEVTDQEVVFDLTELLNRVNTDKQAQAADKNVEYIVDTDKTNLKHRYLIGNPRYLERILNAIIDNAVKFTRPEGRVRVWCAEKSQGKYEFVCEDNGIGMSEEFVAHAFDVFSQENETSRSKYEGTGLGLAIAKKLVDRLGGTIALESKKGSGTTVTITLSFKIEETADNEEALKEEIEEAEGTQDAKNSDGIAQDISLVGKHALIAEDNELNMEIAKFMLEDNGINVDCACDGLEVIKKFEESASGYYDVIFMDIMMPNLNGWDTTRRIRAMKRADATTIPIIAMSANAFSEDIINSRISGMNQHLMKPLDETKLIAAMKEGILNRSVHKV